jgi:hypothetical protein
MNDTSKATATQEPEWIDDGHQVRVTLDYAQFTFAVICPSDGVDLTGKGWADLPACRRAGDDDGNPDPGKSPTATCGLAMLATEFATDEFFDEKAPAFEVVSPFPVEYHFGWDGDAVYVRPKTQPESDEAKRLLIADASAYLAVIHRHANRHDVLGVDLGCAGCALLDRIEAEPELPFTPVARDDRHFSPGYRGEIPNHLGRAETCVFPECRTAQSQHEAVADIQDLTYELFADRDSRDGDA